MGGELAFGETEHVKCMLLVQISDVCVKRVAIIVIKGC